MNTRFEVARALRVVQLAIEEAPTLERFRVLWPSYCKNLPVEIKGLGDRIAVAMYENFIESGYEQESSEA